MIRMRGPRWGIEEFSDILGSTYSRDPMKPQEKFLKILCSEISGWNFLPLVSGRVALALALKVLGVRDGDNVAVPVLCCGAVLAAINAIKARPIYIDMEPETLSASASSLKGLVEKNRISCIVMAHAIGALSDISSILSVAGGFDIPVIDDAAYLAGLKGNGNYYYGTNGYLGIWSFNNKALQGLGGGILLYPDTIKQEVERYSSQFVCVIESHPAVIKEGVKNLLRSIFKSKIPPFLSGDKEVAEGAKGKSGLPDFEGFHLASPIQIKLMIDQWKKRKMISRILERNFSIFESGINKISDISVIPLKYGGRYVQYLPVILKGKVPLAEQVIVTSDWASQYQIRSYLYSKGIQSSSVYPPYFLKDEGGKQCPVYRSYWKKIVFLPAHSLISENQVKYIVDVLASWATKNRMG